MPLPTGGADDANRTRNETVRSCVVGFAGEGQAGLIGSTVIREYSYGLLTIRYQPEQGSLDIWFVGKVLAVERWCGKPQLIRYTAGSWEGDLMEAAKVAA